MPATVVQAKSVGYDTSSSTKQITLPGAITQGNILVLMYSTFGGQPSVPTGWTKLFWQVAGADSLGVYYKTAGASEPTTITITTTDSNNAAASVMECSKVSSVLSNVHNQDLTPNGTTKLVSESYTAHAAHLLGASSLVLGFNHQRDTLSTVTPGTIQSTSGFVGDASGQNTTSGRTAVCGHCTGGAINSSVTLDVLYPDTSYDRGAIALVELAAILDVTANYTAPSPRFAGPAFAPEIALEGSYDMPSPRFAGPVFSAIINNPSLTTEAHLQALYTQDVAGIRTTEAHLQSLYNISAPIRTTEAHLAILWADPQPDPPKPNWKRRPTSAAEPVNMYSERTPKGPRPVMKLQRPALKYYRTVGDGPIRKIFSFRIAVASIGGGVDLNPIFQVSGDKLYREGNVQAGNLPVANSPVRVAQCSNITPGQNGGQIVLVSGGNAYQVNDGAVQALSIPDNQSVIDVVNVGERFVFQIFNSDRFYWSAVNDPTVIDGLSFATAEADPDQTIGLGVLGQDLVLFGAHTTEFWDPQGDNDQPYIRSGGRTYDKGCVAIETIINADNGLYWLAPDRIFYRTGAAPVRVSNNEVEAELGLIPDDHLGFAECGTFVFNGHTFITLTIPGPAYGRGSEFGTWVYDIQTGEWVKWKSWDKDRFRARTFHNGLAGDVYTGAVFKLDPLQCYDSDGTENGFDPIERVASKFVPLKQSPLRLNSVGLYCDMGVGQISGWGSDPKVEMRFSTTEGANWSDWLTADLGPMGQYTMMGAVWRGLGQVSGPGIYFEFRCTDPVMFTVYDVALNQDRY